MRVICLLCDSLNRHFLSPYGFPVAETPHLDWLAERSYVFEKHFSGSLPTMPTRRELWTGNHEFLRRPWGALEPWDRELPEIIRSAGNPTALITDSYHLFERGSGNYHFHFDGWEFFRGFENDPWVTEPTEIPRHKGRLGDRYARNMRRMTREDDLPPVKTLSCVDRWLRANYSHESFFLMIDEFAPHEPFNAPEYLVRRYDPDYNGVPFFWPTYGRNVHDEDEVRQLRNAYAAHVTLLDKYIGRMFETMTELNMWDDTAFILMTDHGHFLGEHGYTGKPPCPQYDPLVHIPLMIFLPGRAGGRVSALSANVDLFPTILDLFGLESESPVHGRSLIPLMNGSGESVRDWALYGYYGRWVNVTDGVHTYFRCPRGSNSPLFLYSLRWEFGLSYQPALDERLEMGKFMENVDMPVGRFPAEGVRELEKLLEPEDRLFNIDEDPGQTNDLAGTTTVQEFEMRLKEAMESIDSPEEQFQRLGM